MTKPVEVRTAYRIEKGIPLPHGWNVNNGNRTLYPWRDMEVGDSFFVPNCKPEKLSGSKTAIARATGRKFAIRSVDGGVRVWRTA